MTDLRTCARCSATLPLDEFPRGQGKPLGRGYACKACERERAARRRAEQPASIAAARARYLERNPDAQREATRRYRQRNPGRNPGTRDPIQRRAHQAVHRALKRGALVRPSSCEDCGREGAPQAHHDDYERPLDVRWLCASCHKLHHLKEAA